MGTRLLLSLSAAWLALPCLLGLIACSQEPQAHTERPQEVLSTSTEPDQTRIRNPRTGEWLRAAGSTHNEVIAALPFEWPQQLAPEQLHWTILESRRGTAYYVEFPNVAVAQVATQLKAAILQAGFNLDGAYNCETESLYSVDYVAQDWRICLSTCAATPRPVQTLSVIPETTDQRAVVGSMFWDRPDALPAELSSTLVVIPRGTLLSVQLDHQQTATVLVETEEVAAEVLAFYRSWGRQEGWELQQQANGWRESFVTLETDDASLHVVCTKESPSQVNMVYRLKLAELR